MKKSDLKLTLEFNKNAEFSDSNAGLDEGKKYVVSPCNSSNNELATSADNKNILVHACLKADFEREGGPTDGDFFKATVGSRAFKDCHILSNTQKKASVGEWFELSWTPGEERKGNDGNPYVPKIYKSKRYVFEEEG